MTMPKTKSMDEIGYHDWLVQSSYQESEPALISAALTEHIRGMRETAIKFRKVDVTNDIDQNYRSFDPRMLWMHGSWRISCGKSDSWVNPNYHSLRACCETDYDDCDDHTAETILRRYLTLGVEKEAIAKRMDMTVERIKKLIDRLGLNESAMQRSWQEKRAQTLLYLLRKYDERIAANAYGLQKYELADAILSYADVSQEHLTTLRGDSDA